jgi:hypothetical protein
MPSPVVLTIRPRWGGNGGIDEDFPEGLEPSQSALLVATHETAVPGDVSRQHGSKPSFHSLCGQKEPLNR